MSCCDRCHCTSTTSQAQNCISADHLPAPHRIPDPRRVFQGFHRGHPHATPATPGVSPTPAVLPFAAPSPSPEITLPTLVGPTASLLGPTGDRKAQVTLIRGCGDTCSLSTPIALHSRAPPMHASGHLSHGFVTHGSPCSAQAWPPVARAPRSPSTWSHEDGAGTERTLKNQDPTWRMSGEGPMASGVPVCVSTHIGACGYVCARVCCWRYTQVCVACGCVGVWVCVCGGMVGYRGNSPVIY